MSAYKILIAEDEGLIALDIASRLETLGHTVAATASTAAEAVEWAKGSDIVLMDIRLDGPVDGIDAAIRIRAQHHLPVVFLTAHADGSTLERAKSAGPYGYLVKPVASASLQTTIEIALYKHRLQRQLEESESWLRATLHSAADAVIVTDPGGTIRMLNPAAEKLFETRPVTASDCVPGDPAGVAILTDGPVALAVQGNGRELEGCAAPVKSAGAVIGAVITLRDVSAQRREQARARHRDKAGSVARFAGGVAEDYGGLIAVIRNQSEQLLRQFADYTPVRQALEEIQRAAAAADQLTLRLGGMAAMEPGRTEIISLHGMLRRMSQLIQSVVGATTKFTIRPRASTGKIHADAAQVEGLLMRLVLHAANALAQGGHLTIETADAGDHVSLSATHDGAPPETTGQDFSIASYISADDERRLEVFFPRWSEPAPAGAGAPTLLLIEPREHIRSRLHNFFEANGYNLLEAGDGDQARTLLEFQEVDLLIAGTREIATAFMASAITDSVPVLAMTTPYTEQALLQQVRATLESRPPAGEETPTFSASNP